MIQWEEFFYYDESSPTGLRWAVDRFRGKNGCTKFKAVGDIAGGGNCHGYHIIHTKELGRFQGHRVVWELHNGHIPEGMEIDHVDGNRANNKLGNLRLATASQNSRNRAQRSDNMSQIVGVSRHNLLGRKGESYSYWVAQWTDGDGTRRSRRFNIKHLGDEGALKAAVAARNEAVSELTGTDGAYSGRHGIK